MVNEVVLTGRALAKRERRRVAQISLSTQAQFLGGCFSRSTPGPLVCRGSPGVGPRVSLSFGGQSQNDPPPRRKPDIFDGCLCMRRLSSAVISLVLPLGCPRDLRSGRSMWRCQRISGASPEAKAQDGPRPAVPSQATTIGGLCFQSIPLRARRVAHRIVRERRKAKRCPCACAHAHGRLLSPPRPPRLAGSQRSVVVV